MKRSEVNLLLASARQCFERNGWALPPSPRWDVTDFGLHDWRETGLVLVNLCEEPEYCEKLMYALGRMKTPAHAHRVKKEDIVSRWGEFEIRVFLVPELVKCDRPEVKVDGQTIEIKNEAVFRIVAGSRITLFPGVFHEFRPMSQECILGEVSTANDDLVDNVFLDAKVGRFSLITEDEPKLEKLVGDS
jgi:D-lyxose ketol-isomerase